MKVSRKIKRNAFWSWAFLVLILDAFISPAAFSVSGNAASSWCGKKPEAKEALDDAVLRRSKKEEHVNLEDYRHYDPTPSSKSRIHSGPIEHGSPLNPYVVPKPPPPPPSSDHPKPGPSPSPS